LGNIILWLGDLGVIDEINKNKIINPPTISRNMENPIQELLDMLEIRILNSIVI
jgi:hypothetical protein